MNFKNGIIQSLFISILSQQLASADDFKGFFIGAEGGYIFGNSHMDREINKVAFPNSKDDKFQINAQNVIGGIFLEYNHVIANKFLLGLQVNAKYSKLSGKVSNTHIVFNQSLTSDLKMKHSYGMILKVGYHTYKILPFITVGLLSSKWSSKTQGMPFLGQGHISKNLTGYELGAGIDYSLTKNIIIGAKFAHAWYSKFSYPNILRSRQMLHIIKVRPQTNTLSFNVKWKL